MAKKSKFLNDLSSSTPILLVLLLVAVFLLGSLTTKLSLQNQGTTAKTTQAATVPNQPNQAAAPAKVDVDAGHLPVLGSKNAKVTVIEFGDFQCPFCEKWFTDVEANLIKDYVNTGKVKFAFRHFAFLGEESTWAAEASECANEQGKFWEYHDYLYKNQGPERSGTFAKDKLKGFAQVLGLDTTKFNSCLDSDKYAKNVTDDQAAGQKAGVNGTPTTFVNGQTVVGAQPYSALKVILNQELSK